MEASKLLVTIRLNLSNPGFLDLDHKERNLFGRFNNTYYWDAVIKDSSIPDDTNFADVDPAAPHDILPMRGVYEFDTILGFPGLHTVYFGSAHAMNDDDVKAESLETNARLVQSRGLSSGAT